MKRSAFLRFLAYAAALVLIMSMIAAVIPALQRASERDFQIGFPFPFLTIHVLEERFVSTHHFATHLNLSGLTGDLLIAYCICYGINLLKKKAR